MATSNHNRELVDDIRGRLSITLLNLKALARSSLSHARSDEDVATVICDLETLLELIVAQAESAYDDTDQFWLALHSHKIVSINSKGGAS